MEDLIVATPVFGLGIGGHARVILEMLRDVPAYEVVALLDADPRSWGTTVAGVPVPGGDDLLRSPEWDYVRHFFIGIGSVGPTARRREAYERAAGTGRIPIRAVHTRAIISRSAVIGDGATVMAGAIINTGVTLGVNVIINTGAIIDHDSIVGDHAHVATGAHLSGGVRVGVGAHIGSGATVRQYVSIGADAVVGSGAVVLKDVPAGETVVGVPAEPIHRR